MGKMARARRGLGGDVNTADLVILFGSLSALVGSILVALANYRNSVKRADFDRALARIVDTEARLAQAESRAATNESRANASDRRADEYRQDVQKLGEAIERERTLNTRNLGMVARDAEAKIEKMLLVIEDLYRTIEQTTGTPPNVDMAALRKLMVLDHVTGPLGQIDLLPHSPAA